MDTKAVNKIVLRDNALKKVIHAELYKEFREALNQEYLKLEKKYFSEEWIKFSCNGESGYWNSKKNKAVPILKSYDHVADTYFGLKPIKIKKKMVDGLFGKKSNCPKEIENGLVVWNGFHCFKMEIYSYSVESKQDFNLSDSYTNRVGVVYISDVDFKKLILSKKFEILSDETFKKAVILIDEKSILETNDKEECISEQDVEKLIQILKLNRSEIEQEVTDKVMKDFVISPEISAIYTQNLLGCDKIRADLEDYDKKCLEDVNAGHWELWFEKEPVAEKGQVVATLEKPLIARNPVADIHEDGLIGIDFGTKSTIVSKRDGREKTTLLRVGTGRLNKKAEAQHYENPTIMEFLDLEKFLSDYHKRDGRPETSIDDLRVSHTANNDLQSNSVSDAFYSYFYDIKQWCGDTERNVKIVDQKGVERLLPAFVQLNDDAFNPLELYAYYLGLYINNMRNGIYLDYVLSFPVTYEKTVKEKILQSFTTGLRKSLPETILENKEIMEKFRVRQGVSEPAAYAITALQGYGFEPEEDENILYAIFDFGGGTTDFDFGLWRCADDSKREERRYDYVIEHFGSEGDKYLGGENLLELMAYEIFKANADLLGKKKGNKKKKEENDEENSEEEQDSAGFSFSKPKECDAFPGSETLISNSQEARRNTKQLMEALRPFWEGIIGIATKEDKNEEKEKDESEKKNNPIAYHGYLFRNDEECKFPIEEGYIKVDLFDKDGNRKSEQRLYVENEDKGIHLNLIEVLEKRIDRGVSNFFTSIYLAFRNDSAVKSGVDGIQIFLAGNSSKSPILRKIFAEYIEKEKEQGKGYFELFPPLGTPEAIAIQRERGVTVNETDITAPTGKTGVAYGLIAGREGGKIKVISETEADKQTKFRYNIGVSKRGKFKIVLDRNIVAYGQWVPLIDAGVEDFEIYYTSLPNAAKMSVDETGIYNKRCRLPYTDEDADVYIRCTEESPEDIEYCISTSEEPPEDVEIIRIHLSE
ncbi:MAG: hypothetical protein ACI4HI_00940 [Lachnospiraceae bacterium]